MMLSHSSAIDKRRQMHRRQNSTPAIFEATQIRPPANLLQQHMGHRRGMSFDQNARTPGQLSPGHRLSVSIPETVDQQPQHHMQEAQQQSNVQPGSPFPQTIPQTLPQTPRSARFPPRQPHTPSQTPQQVHRPSTRELKELEDHIKRVYGVNGNIYVSILPTPVSTPEKPSPLPIPDDMDLPMPTSLGQMAELSLNPPAGDRSLFDSDPVEIPDNEGYESSYYSDAISPARSPTGSPQQKSISNFLEQVRHVPRLAFPFNPSSSFPPTSQSVDSSDPFYAHQNPPSSPRQRALSELNINGSVLDTGFSESDINRYMSEQDPQTQKWTCMFEDCGKDFQRKENIRSHIQTHLGDRPYKCNLCDKCFVRSHDLKRHLLIHSDAKPYICKCGSGFARQDALTRHRQRGMCAGGLPNPNRGSARRGRPRKERPDMEKRISKANKTRKSLASAPSSASEESSISSEPSQDFKPSVQELQETSPWTSQSFDFNGSMQPSSSQQSNASSSSSEGMVNDMFKFPADYKMEATQEFVNHTPSMSANDSPSPLSMSSPEFSSEPDSSFTKSFFDTTPAKLDELFSNFVPGKETDWVQDMINGDHF